MDWLLSFLPRRSLQLALLHQWARTLPRDQRVRLYYWGTPGAGTSYHEFQWADDITKEPRQ